MNRSYRWNGLISALTVTVLLFINSLQAFSQQAWTRVPSPDPSETRNILSGISGTSSADVWVVGHFTSPGDNAIRNYIMHWDGDGWQIFPGTDAGFNYNDLWDVTAITENDVWAAGTYNVPGSSRSQLLHWDGSGWTHAVLPAISGGSFLFSIDAISSNDIWAVGGQAGSPTDPAYAIHYDGTNWTAYTVPNAGSYANSFEAVDGIASNDVWAVGRKSNSYGDFHAMAQHWNGSNWTNIPLPSSIESPIGVLESVTMIASDNVWAMGSTVTGTLLMIHWDGTSWSEVATAGSAGGAIVARATDIFGVGDRISNWNGSGWMVIEPLSHLSYPSLVSAISFPNGDVWAAGRTVDDDGNFYSLVYRTANSIPEFVHGNSQTLVMGPNGTQNIDGLLQVQDADMNQVVIYTVISPPLHGELANLPDTVITSNGFAIPSGITYQPAGGYIGPDQVILTASVGPLFSQSIININVLTALPVVMGDYSVLKSGSVSTIQWNTLSESNTKEFMLERGIDGLNFNVINRVAAHGSAHQYKLIDPYPLPGSNYYRLLLIDIDGKQTIYPVKRLYFEKNELRPFQVLTNPVLDRKISLLINTEENGLLGLYNQLGHLVYKWTINAPSSFLQLNLPDKLTPGLYFLSLNMKNKSLTEKIIIK